MHFCCLLKVTTITGEYTASDRTCDRKTDKRGVSASYGTPKRYSIHFFANWVMDWHICSTSLLTLTKFS